jgi:hypothetical protein
MVVHICNPSTLEAKAGGSQGQPRYITGPFLKKKKKKSPGINLMTNVQGFYVRSRKTLLRAIAVPDKWKNILCFQDRGLMKVTVLLKLIESPVQIPAGLLW